MPHFTIKRLPEPEHPRDLHGTARRPHVVTSTAFSAWHDGRHPEQSEAARRRLAARHLEQAPPSEYVWLIGTGGVLVDEGTLGVTHGRHRVIYSPALPPARMVLAKIVLTVEPSDRY